MAPTGCPRSSATASADANGFRRRRLLGAISLLTAGTLAGCLGPGADPEYETGTIDDPGEPRTPDEAVAADAIAQQEPHDDVAPLDALVLVEHDFVLEDGYQGSTVQGIVENGGDDRVDLAEVRVRVYDDADAHRGRYFDRTGDLAPGGRWAFTVVIFTPPDELASYDVAVLATPS